ncbi:multidrug resistance efflux transporter family protein [Pontibacter vulgaris]|uniref:multidrug resistance efflux transporter family protein n=1 Tax=Pontibacter vulgaris TaxID=2905679 RepID=UPI001FA7AB22|nr:multidrug resistance efflux transporter family protein [Pontibacter vulgaris]
MQVSDNLKAVAIGSVAGVFFCSTYVVNSFLSVNGGHWAWTVGLRSFFLALLLMLLLQVQGQLKQLLQVLKQQPLPWMAWGSTAFGIVYVLLTYAASLGPGWLIAGVFQFTIVAGILISPLIYKDHRAKIPVRALLLSILILAGIALMQWSQKNGVYTSQQLWICVVLTLAAAFLWPLANRKLMLHQEAKGIKLNSFQRVAGIAIGSFPAQLILFFFGYNEAGWPGQQQLLAVLVIALSSGVIGCILFFKAMHIARNDGAALAAVEATQSVEIVTTVIGEVLLLGIAWPNWMGYSGIAIIMSGLILYGMPSQNKQFSTNKIKHKA